MKELSVFACQCGDKNNIEMTDLHQWLKETFKFPTDEDGVFWYTTRLVSEIIIGYGALISNIGFDQWGGLSIVTAESEGWQEEAVNIYVQFDRFEDGLAIGLKTLYDTYGGTSRKWKEEEGNDNE